MENNAPWKLVKEDKESAAKILYTAAECLRISALLLAPVMPNRTTVLINTLNASGTSFEWGGLIPGNKIRKHDPLFPRI